MTEIEIRGKINQKEFNYLFELFAKKGKLVDHYHRLSVDISPGFDQTTRMWPKSSPMDIRIKKSDDKEKISIKVGHFNKKKRQEIEVKLQPGEFVEALNLFELLGYKTGMIYSWESWEYAYQGFEVKLSKYSNEYFTFEIEGKEKLAVNGLAKQLNLRPYTKEEYRQAIDWENQNIHQIYSRKKVEKLLKLSY